MICDEPHTCPAASARDDEPACRTLYVFQAHSLGTANPVYAYTRRAPSLPAQTRPRCLGSAYRLSQALSVRYRVEAARDESRSGDIEEKWTTLARRAMRLTLSHEQCLANRSPLRKRMPRPMPARSLECAVPAPPARSEEHT